MMIDLGEWLRDGLRRPRQAAVWDCCAFPAAWVMANGLPDPMAAWRGVYSTDVEAEDIVAEHGGLVGIFGAGLESAGLVAVDRESQPGDIGVITVQGEEAGAIFTGRRWAFVADRGLGFVTLTPESVARVWGFP